MKPFKLLIITLLVLWNAYGYSQNNDIVEKFNNTKKQVDDSLSSHFPEIILSKTSSISVKPAVDSEYNEGLTLAYAMQINKEKLKAIIDSLNNLHLLVYAVNSKQSFQIDRPYSKDITNKKCKRNCKNCKPLPHYDRWAHSFFYPKEKLPKDLKFYIIDTKQGEYLSKNLLTKGGGLPKEWKNGYSKGIAISEKTNTVVYWLVVW